MQVSLQCSAGAQVGHQVKGDAMARQHAPAQATRAAAAPLWHGVAPQWNTLLQYVWLTSCIHVLMQALQLQAQSFLRSRVGMHGMVVMRGDAALPCCMPSSCMTPCRSISACRSLSHLACLQRERMAGSRGQHGQNAQSRALKH